MDRVIIAKIKDIEMNESEEELFEELADIEHQRWSDWQKYLHSKCVKNDDGSLTISSDDVSRWEKQINTDYEDLSEKEKDSDREQVQRYWELIQSFIKE